MTAAASAAPLASPAEILRGFALPEDWRIYLRPVGLLAGEVATQAVAARVALPLAGGPFAFDRVELILRRGAEATRTLAPLSDLMEWAQARGVADAVAERLDRLSASRAPLAGLTLDRPLIMGVVNVTPDSFSDGGDFAAADVAVAQGLALRAAGADILDVGGESTRPGAAPVSPEVEQARILPVVKALAAEGAVLSVDTRWAATARAALAAGARLVNDVTALAGDPDMLELVAASGAPAILMHMQGEPQTMQADPRYDAASLDVFDYLESRIAACEAAGIPRSKLIVDPGVGFGKALIHNLDVIAHGALYHGLGCGVLFGVSRKRFIAALSRDEPPKARMPGSVAAGLAALEQGVQILRVHDVAETAQAVAVWRAARAG